MEAYLDNASTTVLDPEVEAAMMPYLEEHYGSTGCCHVLGAESRKAVREAQASIAAAINCDADELHWTSGGTEANNWVVKGCAPSSERWRLMYGAAEHSSVIAPCRFLAEWRQQGAVIEVPVDAQGRVVPSELEKQLDAHGDETALVCLQHANNEVGTMQPVAEVAEMAHAHGCLLHVDACQTLGKVPVDTFALQADTMAFSAHKLHGPMGTGALFVKRETSLHPLLHGGDSNEARAGTVNVPCVVGFAQAVRTALRTMDGESARQKRQVEEMWAACSMNLPSLKRNGDPENRLPGILNFTVPFTDCNRVASRLGEEFGIFVGCGSSACRDASHVILAMGGSMEDARGSLRISLSKHTAQVEAWYVASCLRQVLSDKELWA